MGGACIGQNSMNQSLNLHPLSGYVSHKLMEYGHPHSWVKRVMGSRNETHRAPIVVDRVISLPGWSNNIPIPMAMGVGGGPMAMGWPLVPMLGLFVYLLKEKGLRDPHPVSWVGQGSSSFRKGHLPLLLLHGIHLVLSFSRCLSPSSNPLHCFSKVCT